MAEIIYFKDVLFIKPKEEAQSKKRKGRPRLKPMKESKSLKSPLIGHSKEDIKRK